MPDEVIYREFHVVGRLAAMTALFGVVLFVGFLFVGPPVRGVLMVGAIFSIFPCFHLASVYRSSRIVLRPDRLRVGGETFTPADFDLAFGVQPPLVLAPDEQADVETRYKLADEDQFRIAGGTWGKTIGTEMVVLREAGSERLVAVFTRRPTDLDPVLTRWIETAERSGGGS